MVNLRSYEALLARPDNLARIEAQRRSIERAGGQLHIAPASQSGLIMVTLMLPASYRPDDFLPGLPFYAN
jgi:hypothetical protein